MKRILALLLALVMMFSMAACSSSLETETATEGQTETKAEDKTEKRDPTGFAAGFAREVISPEFPTGMGGYGNTSSRRSTTIAQDIFASCVAVSDGENKALFFSIDVLSVSTTNRENICRRVEKELGIPPENVIISATHNHAGPNVSSGDESVANYMQVFYTKVMKVAKDAVADLDQCTMKIGRTYTKDLSYVRRYFREDGTFHGTNHLTTNTSPIVRHETEVDNEMQILLFDRKNGKDIAMCNWQCHATTAGGVEKTVISSDWVGALRDAAEKDGDVLFSYHQGAAGNVVPSSFITSEKSNSDYTKHGKEIAQVFVKALETLTPVDSGKIRGIEKQVTCYFNNDVSGYNLEHAAEIQKYYKEGDRSKANALCLEYGFSSAYHANSVMYNSQRTVTSGEMTLGALAIGDIGFASAPYEMFDTNGMEVKSGSKFTMTFMCAYTGNHGYIPSEIAWPNGGYEVETTSYARGTGEQLSSELIAMVNSLK